MATDPVLTGPPVASVAEAVERMRAIGAVLPAGDGLACFNRMYLQITVDVAGRLGGGFFAEAAFMDHLDVVFANRYLAAAAASVTEPARVPRAWAALLERRSDPSVAPLQFAVAGMNAHINHDLPLAVVAACRDLGLAPDQGSHRPDFDKVNLLLAAAEEGIRRSFEDEMELELERHFHGVENVVANWSIAHARSGAWTNAETLWALRSLPRLQDDYAGGLDRLVGMVGRCLLVPTA